MAKFHGVLGYVKTVETAPGVFREQLYEKECIGDILRNVKSIERSENLLPDLNINNRFSIVADDYTFENMPYIRYIKLNGTSWAVNSVEIQRPRLLLSVRGVYNG